jgi:hypothetical protein
MLSLLKDPLVKIGAFIIMYIILSGLWAAEINAWGIYMAFLAFMLLVSIIMPESMDITSIMNSGPIVSNLGPNAGSNAVSNLGPTIVSGLPGPVLGKDGLPLLPPSYSSVVNKN